MNIGSIGGSTAMLRLGPPPHSPDKAMGSTAKLLGMSTDDLKKELSSGKTLNDLAKAQGVSHDALISSITDGLKASAPAGVQAPAGLDPTKIAEDIAAGKAPGGSSVPSPPGGRSAFGDSADKLASLSSALGLDVNALLQHLQAGAGSGLLEASDPYAKTAGLPTSGLQADYFA
ncbi:MAG: hypothetical protein U0R70_11455 [Solirubrobacteraceae bacterium]